MQRNNPSSANDELETIAIITEAPVNPPLKQVYITSTKIRFLILTFIGLGAFGW